MRSIFLVATISALAWARPETYRETEDFKFSRSSSDEGTKSGYYGAQRGNMAGNYERAHNMDSLAQHHMSGAINQVEGELGDASKTRAGSVYTAANSRGVYGSGHYDASNLQGRNFGESSAVDSSHSSLSSSAYDQRSQNSDWRSQSQQTGFGASNQLGQASLRAADSATATGYGASHYGGSNSHSTGYQSSSGYNSQSGYSYQDQSNLNGQSASAFGTGGTGRYTVVTPVRLVGRPGTQIAIPVYAQAYDSQTGASGFGHSSNNRQTYASQRASAFDQNSVDSEAEVLNNNQQHISSVPVTNGKHYSSSYNYHKAWERRSETTDLPVTVAPTLSPLPKNSELYEDVQGISGSDLLQHTNSQNSYSGNAYNSANRYNSNSQSASSQSRHQSDYSSQHRSQADANSNAYTQGTYGSHAGLSPIASSDSLPKSYQSSYSYHKSWEKQGDPYVIVPATNGEPSQRIVSGIKTSASSQHGSQSHQHYSNGAAIDCDSLCRYRRSARSYRTEDYYQQNQEDLGQQAQRGWEENEQQQSQKLEDLGQQTQQSWDNFQQQSKPEKLEESWGNIEQQQSQKLEDLGQQTQQSWDNFQQQSKPEKLEDLGQQTQQSWGNLQHQSRPQKLEDFGQQTQGKWQDFDQESKSNLEDLGQQTQQSWGQSNIEQQENVHNLEDLGQQTQGQWDKMETTNQQSQETFGNLHNLGQQTQSNWDDLESLGQHTQHNIPQQTEDLGQQTQNKWDTIDNLGKEVQWNNINTINKTRHTDTTNTEQQTQTQLESVSHIKPNTVHADDKNSQDTFNNQNSNINNPSHPAFWGITNEQKHENNYYYNQQHSYNNNNSYSNSQRHGTSWQEQVNNNNRQGTNNNPLQSLWDKLDNMEQQSEHSSNEYQQHTKYNNSQNSYYEQHNIYHQEHNGHNSSYHRDQQETHYSWYQPPIVFNSTVDKPKNDQQNQGSITENSKDDDVPEKPEPAEVGRGDIGPEDNSHTDGTTPRTVLSSETYSTQRKPEKTPEEIEALSLSRGTEENTNQLESDSLSVLSISQQKWLEDQRRRAANEHQVSGSRSTSTTSTTTPRPVINENTSVSSVHSVSQDKHKNLFESSQDSSNTYLHFDSHNEKPKQPEEIQQGNKDNQNRQNTEHQSEDFGQQNQDLNQQTLQHFENLGHHDHKFNQQNTGQELEDFGQQTQDLNQQLGQHTQNFDQQNTGEQLEDLEQQSQQNVQFQNVGQQSQNFDQQTGQDLMNFGQQNQDLSQQNVQQFENLDHNGHNFNQQNTGQELVDFGQQTQDLNQQSLQQFQDLGQQSQNTGQLLEDFGQQSQDLNQQNVQQLENLGQHSQNFDQQNTGQQLEDFGQQSQDVSQQNLQQFENLGNPSQNSNHAQAREFVPHSNPQPIHEEKITPVTAPGSQSHPKQDEEIVPPSVTTTEKPGFWKSVGNKFTSAKDSVASWFGKS